MEQKSGEFGRAEMLEAFDRLATFAIANGTRLDIAVYGGSALMLAGNFRFSTEDVDVSVITGTWPDWLSEAVASIASDMGIADDWLNNAVEFHLSPLASLSADHVEFGTFPRGGEATGMSVFVPTARYMLAMKLKAMRLNDPAKGGQEAEDILNLMKAANVDGIEEAISLLACYYPKSAENAGKHRFLLKHLLKNGAAQNAPCYPARGM